MTREIIIENKSQINKFSLPKSRNNKYKLLLKDKKYDLLFIYGELIKINEQQLSINEIQNYGGWKLALRGIIREYWLREIDNKTEEEILKDKDKLFSKCNKNSTR